ncbi:PTPS-domain-containing protein [Backusella circina FSU 941]|nr:PTPS-domain-containing protein [Backusella circina FSU 941]
MPAITYITRSETFSAAHRLNSPQLSAEQNKQLYGKCNHPNFHGHNYKVEITLKGQVNPATGMVINLVDLKKCIQLAVMDPLDHRNLDMDVEYFKKRPSTTENLAIFIWWNFQYHFLRNDEWRSTLARLYKVKVYETEHNIVEYMGEGELDECDSQLDVNLIKLLGVDIKL